MKKASHARYLLSLKRVLEDVIEYHLQSQTYLLIIAHLSDWITGHTNSELTMS